MICPEYVDLPYHNHQLVNLLRAHTAGDFCLVGPAGCGKSVLVKKFAELLSYDVEPVILYQVRMGTPGLHGTLFLFCFGVK